MLLSTASRSGTHAQRISVERGGLFLLFCMETSTWCAWLVSLLRIHLPVELWVADLQSDLQTRPRTLSLNRRLLKSFYLRCERQLVSSLLYGNGHLGLIEFSSSESTHVRSCG